MAVSLLRLWVSSVRPSTRRFASAQDEVALEFFSAIKKPPHALGVTRQKMSMPLEKSTHPEQAPNGRAVEGRDKRCRSHPKNPLILSKRPTGAPSKDAIPVCRARHG